MSMSMRVGDALRIWFTCSRISKAYLREHKGGGRRGHRSRAGHRKNAVWSDGGVGWSKSVVKKRKRAHRLWTD
eukprot:2873551-Pyramimonas_sp.AAC.2